MGRYLAAVIAAAAAVLLTAVPALASSNAVLSDGAANPNGTNTPVGAVLMASGTLTFSTSTSGGTVIKCPVTLSLTVQTNPTAPGTATTTLTSVTFTGSCTISGSSGIKSVSLAIDHLPYNVTFSSGGGVTISPGSSGSIHFTFKFTNTFNQTITCGYHVHDSSGNITGMYSNSNNTITITNAQLDGDSSNNGQCPPMLFLSATLKLQHGTVLVFVN